MKSISKIIKLIPILLPICLLLGCQKKPKPIPHLNFVEHQLNWEEKTACTLILNQKEKLKAKAKFRGGSSSKFGKKSYSLELDEAYAFGNLPADDDWILNATYIDKTFMRHKISYDLFREMSPKNRASKSIFVESSRSSVYEGLYVLMEKINASYLGLNTSDSLAMLFKGPLFLYEQKLTPQDSANYYHQKYPKIESSDKTAYLEAFRTMLFSADDRIFETQIAHWVDVENMADWQILLLYTNNSDGIMKNFYLYKIDTQTPFRIAIWDYDHAFGRDGDGELNMMERILDLDRSILFKRLMTMPSYRSLLKSRWKKYRTSGLISEQDFEQRTEAIDKQIRPYLKSNFEKWPIHSSNYADSNTYDQEVQLMKDFVALRIPDLDQYFEQLN
ncbi:MAG: CotH kinase family protein [Flavobacteriales bacterium]